MAAKEQRSAYQNMLDKRRKDKNSVGDVPPQVAESVGTSIGSFLYEPRGENAKKDESIRMILIGKTGSGKSTTGNTILSKEHFKSKMSGSCVTQDCKLVKDHSNDPTFSIVDTPGFCQPGYSDAVLMKKVAKGIAMTPPGPHVFLLVMAIGGCSREEAEMVKVITDHLGEEVKKFMVVIFTHKDILVREKIGLDDYIKSLPVDVKKFINGLGKRFVSFDNKDKEPTQVKELMDMVGNVVMKNEGKAYSTKLSQEKQKFKFQTDLPKLSEKCKAGQMIHVTEAEDADKYMGDELGEEFDDEEMDVKIQLLHMKEKVRMKEIEASHREMRSKKHQKEIDHLNRELQALQENIRNKDREINDTHANDKQLRQELADLFAQLAHEQEQIRCRDRFIQDLLMELKLTKSKHQKMEKKFDECKEKLAQFTRQRLEDIYKQSPNRPMTSKNQSLPTCSICCDRAIQSFVIPCGHSFCCVCIAEIGERYKKCPKCRKRFKNCGMLYI